MKSKEKEALKVGQNSCSYHTGFSRIEKLSETSHEIAVSCKLTAIIYAHYTDKGG